MVSRTVSAPRLVLARQITALLDAAASEKRFPSCLAVVAAGGHGKTMLLQELALRHQRAGRTVVDAWQDGMDSVDPDSVLLVDDAQLLDDSKLRQLRRLLQTETLRLVLAYRPWPRPSALLELADLIKRQGCLVQLSPYTEEQVAAHVRMAAGVEPSPPVAAFLHAQTGGVPRFVDRLVRALPGPDAITGKIKPEVPQSTVIQFGEELADLGEDVHTLLLAAASGLELPGDLLCATLSRPPEAVADVLAATQAAGLLTQDGRLPPIVARGIVALSPVSRRAAVWRHLAELQLQRGGRVLPLVRPLLDAGVGGGFRGAVLKVAAEEALPDEPALAATLFAAADASGHPATVRWATAAVLAGDLDAALRLADQIVATEDSSERAEAAAVAATALTHRGHGDRGAELFRWSGGVPARAFAAIGSAASGRAEDLERVVVTPPTGGPPTLHASAALLMAQGVWESLSGSPTTALSTLVQAATLLEPSGRTTPLPDSPAALAALVALHSGEWDIGARVLDRALSTRLGAALMSRRHRLLQGWIHLVRGRVDAAGNCLAAATSDGVRLEPRDLLFATALELGLARRTSDLSALQRGWWRALDAVVRHPADLFTLLPLGELAIAAARLGELGRLDAYLQQGWRVLEQLGGPALWATPFHWSGLHAAILAEDSVAVDEHVRALAATAGHTRYGSTVATAAESWVEVLRGVIDPARVEAAARGLHDIGLCWDGARLAGQAAIRTNDRRDMAALLDCARVLQGKPASSAGPPGSTLVPGPRVAVPVEDGTHPHKGRLSDREWEVAELVLAGLTYKQIGDQLFISAKTVEHHVARMRQRLSCANRSELLARLRAMAAEASAADKG